MKILVGFSRIFVAILFLFSGFIKLNDPIGFSYKLQEYFGEGVLDLEFLIPYALLIAVFLVVFEIILGVTLILGYLKKFTLWSLLLMILFFTFLTFYSAYFNKVTDCGCFGDALPLTPWESFAKDVVLSVLILILFTGRKYITPLKPVSIHKWIVFLCFSFCLVFAYYVLMHLPVFDFRAYKIGTNIQEGMGVPEGAPEAKFDYNWKFNVNGKEKIITTNGSYPKVDGKYISVETEMVSEGYIPPIHDFAIEKDGVDYTTEYLEKDNLIVIVMYNLSKSEAEGLNVIKGLTDKAISQGYDVLGLTASLPKEISEVKQRHGLNFDFYGTDETALKTILRSNPGIVQLKKGTIVEKLHWNDAKKLPLDKVERQKPKLNERLKKQLDSIYQLRKKPEDTISIEEQRVIDSTSIIFIERVIEKYGYPGKTLVGTPTNIVASQVILNSNKLEKYLSVLKGAGEKGELDLSLAVTMQDRYLMLQNREQVYGTQSTTINSKTKKPISVIWPIKNPELVNIKRKEMGLEETIEQYCKNLLGETYRAYTLDEINKLKEEFKK